MKVEGVSFLFVPKAWYSVKYLTAKLFEKEQACWTL